MSIPFALSLSKYVNSTGTDVGFASLLGVALLALLYFASARESRSLRDQLEDAHTRITSLESRLAQSLRNQAARAAATQLPTVPGRPGVVPAPALAPMGTAVARVQRQVPAADGVLVGPAMGAAAPALGSATKLIPAPEFEPAAVPAVPMAVPAAAPAMVPATAASTAAAAAVYAGPGPDSDEFEDDFSPEDTMFTPAARTAAAANGRATGGGGGVAAPPRVQIYDDEADASGPLPRRTIPTVDTGPSRPLAFAGRLGGAIAAVVVVAVIVVALLLITSSGSHAKKTRTASGTHHAKTVTKKAPVFDPAKVKVSVLNGTAISGLAADVGGTLTNAGYTVPKAAVTNASSEMVASTTVSYTSGYGNAALHIAEELHKAYDIALPQTVPATAATVTSCGTPVTTGDAGTCPANVIVTVGNDLSGAADTSTSG